MNLLYRFAYVSRINTNLVTKPVETGLKLNSIYSKQNRNATKNGFAEIQHVPAAVAELTDDHGRMQLYLVGWATWVAAMALLAIIAAATAHWLPYIIATTLPNLLIFLFIRYTTG